MGLLYCDSKTVRVGNQFRLVLKNDMQGVVQEAVITADYILQLRLRTQTNELNLEQRNRMWNAPLFKDIAIFNQRSRVSILKVIPQQAHKSMNLTFNAYQHNYLQALKKFQF